MIWKYYKYNIIINLCKIIQVKPINKNKLIIVTCKLYGYKIYLYKLRYSFVLMTKQVRLTLCWIYFTSISL